ncbi:MAG: hypothetical protein FJ335_01380 [Sphingomonadales bacterium]|nr:hypothetical protein [Sphingomonadales bacterium]
MIPDKLVLKIATQEMIKGVGGLEAAAPYCRVGKTVLGDNQSPNRADSFVAIDVVADLEPLARERSGWPHVTQALCARMGGTFVALPEVPSSRGDILTLLATQCEEHGDLTKALCAALADNRWDAPEIAAAQQAARDVIRSAATILAELDSLGVGQ